MIPRPIIEAPPPVAIKLSKLLLTEGNTATHFCEVLLLHVGLSATIEVRNFGGVGDLTVVLSAIAGTAEFRSTVTSVAILRDAETNAAAARNAVETAIESAKLGGYVKTSVFILPDNTNPGMIETLCIQAVRAHAPLASENACMTGFFQCLNTAGIVVNDPLRMAKNQAQAYLATKPEVQMFPGLAAYRGYWPWACPVFDPLKRFLISL